MTDAFKQGQDPGASQPLGDGAAQADNAAAPPGTPGGATAASTPAAAGVDNGLGGLY